MKTVAIINQKGGVGKTTAVANIGAAVASMNRRVCLIDLDPQSQLTMHLGVEVSDGETTIYDVLTSGASVSDAAVEARENLLIVPSVIDLAAAEMELVGRVGREQVLSDRLSESAPRCDYVIIDCPPSLGLLTLNALAAADTIIIPLQAHFLALQGLGRLLETVSLVQRRINPRLTVGAVLLSMFEKNTRLAGEVLADLTGFFDEARGSSLPWSNVKIFDTPIRRNVKLAECPSYGKSIFEYAPASHGAEDYIQLAEEFLACMENCPVEKKYVPPAETIRQNTEQESGIDADVETAAPQITNLPRETPPPTVELPSVQTPSASCEATAPSPDNSHDVPEDIAPSEQFTSQS